MKNTCHPCSSHFVEEERFKLNTKGILGEGKEAEKSSQQDTKEVAGSWRKMQQPSGQLSFVPVQCTLYSIGEVDTWGAGRKRMQLEANCQLLHTQRQFPVKKWFLLGIARIGGRGGHCPNLTIADSAQTEYCSTFHCPCVRVSVTCVTSLISRIYKGINAMLSSGDPSSTIYTESKSSWLSF